MKNHIKKQKCVKKEKISTTENKSKFYFNFKPLIAMGILGALFEVGKKKK